MGATTRARTGNSKPRIIPTIDSLTTPSTTKRSSTTKANTSKPRTTTGTKVAGGRVSKGKTGSTTTTAKKDKATTAANVKTVKKPRTKTEKVVDAVVGIAEKVVGDLEGKPGKKAAGTAKVRGTDSTTKRKTAVKA